MTNKDEALKLALEKFQSMNHKDSVFHGEFEHEILGGNAVKIFLII